MKVHTIKPGETIGLRLKLITNLGDNNVYVWEERGELYAQCLYGETLIAVK